MKLKQFFISNLALTALLLTINCEKSAHNPVGADSPEQAVNQFVTALSSGDYVGAATITHWPRGNCLGALMPLLDENSYEVFARHHPDFVKDHPGGLADPFIAGMNLGSYREIMIAQAQTMSKGELVQLDYNLYLLTYKKLLYSHETGQFHGESDQHNALLIEEIDGKWFISRLHTYQFIVDPYSSVAPTN